jgi:methionyl-tRNA formyltransferase
VPVREHAPVSLRIVVISTVQPLLERFVPFLRELGYEPVAILTARRTDDAPPRTSGEPELSDATAPDGIDLLFASTKHAIEPLLRAYTPDIALCWGFPWKVPHSALEVPRYGSANLHPALLPRHRGPMPFAWALREGESHFGVTWHRMDAELDTGPILAQTTVPIDDADTTIREIGPKIATAAFGLLPGVLERMVAGDPGDPQSADGVSWAGYFDDDYAQVDFAQPARAIHNQVRAWNLTFGMSQLVAPVAELDGGRVRLIRTSLTDPGGDARRIECSDGPLWVVESETIPTDAENVRRSSS